MPACVSQALNPKALNFSEIARAVLPAFTALSPSGLLEAFSPS
jgi:hypothetical protein